MYNCLVAICLAAPFWSGPIEVDPPISDLHSFPSFEYVQTQRIFNRQFDQSMRMRRSWDVVNRNAIDTILIENGKLYWIWDKLDDAQRRKSYNPEYARTHLTQLRNMLGEEDYMSARMPPCVPFWLIQYKD